MTLQIKSHTIAVHINLHIILALSPTAPNLRFGGGGGRGGGCHQTLLKMEKKEYPNI